MRPTFLQEPVVVGGVHYPTRAAAYADLIEEGQPERAASYFAFGPGGRPPEMVDNTITVEEFHEVRRP